MARYRIREVRKVGEKPRFVLAVGGQEALVYLPLAVVIRLNLFKEVGLDPDVQNFADGGLALRALVGGSADAVSGFYDHTIQMQAQGRRIKTVVMQQRCPGLVLAVTKHAADAGFRSTTDLRGKKIGVTAPGSSTHFFVNYLAAKVGIGLDEFSVIGIGAERAGVVLSGRAHPPGRCTQRARRAEQFRPGGQAGHHQRGRNIRHAVRG
jgi:NitT/TauT family transport system substrate-binding protein